MDVASKVPLLAPGQSGELRIGRWRSTNSGVKDMSTAYRELDRTLKKRTTDVLAHLDRPGTSNGPTEAINGRLEHLRGSEDLPMSATCRAACRLAWPCPVTLVAAERALLG